MRFILSALDNISLPAFAMATVYANVLDCTMQEVTNGFVSMEYEGMHYRYTISQGGSFSFTTILCGNGVGVSFVASDAANLQESHHVIFSIYPGANQLGNLQACDINTMEYMNYTINGSSVHTSSPNGSFSFAWTGASNATVIQGTNSNTGNSMSIAFNFPGTGVGSSQLLLQLYFQLKNRNRCTVIFNRYPGR